MLKKKEKTHWKYVRIRESIDPGPLALKPDTLTTRPRGQVVRRSK